MASFDFKTEAPEAAISDSNLLFGATSYAAEFPSVFPVSTLRTLLIGGGTLAISPGKTLTVTETLTLTSLGAGQTYTFPAASVGNRTKKHSVLQQRHRVVVAVRCNKQWH